MTVFEFALFRYGASLMTPAELERAKALAAKADAGDQHAWLAFKKLTDGVLADARRRKRTRKGMKKNGVLSADSITREGSGTWQ